MPGDMWASELKRAPIGLPLELCQPPKPDKNGFIMSVRKNVPDGMVPKGLPLHTEVKSALPLDLPAVMDSGTG